MYILFFFNERMHATIREKNMLRVLVLTVVSVFALTSLCDNILRYVISRMLEIPNLMTKI